ncbi:lyase family protein [Thermodesulfobacteriota bacterium]
MEKDTSQRMNATISESINLFDSISPIDFRYYGRDEKIKSKLWPYLSEEAVIKYIAKVESVLTNTFAELGICTHEIAQEIENASKKVTAAEAYLEEDRIKHPIRAVVNCIRSKVSKEGKPYVHFTATSQDIWATAIAARYRDLTNNVLIPKLLELEKTLINLAMREKETVQMGRTHGQFAEPITFGFAIAHYVSRLGSRISGIRDAGNNLRGKVAGAVGAYNSLSLFLDDPVEFEAQVLSKLDLKASPISSQIVEAEFVTDYVHSILSAFGVLANIADDMRHLQRSEIAEVQEFFAEEQVGSSTMPQKRNPVRFEYIKSMWKAMMPSIITVYSDQISEHQRDLTNLESARFIGEILAVFYVCVSLLNELMSVLTVNRANLKKNFDLSKDRALGEPAYLLLCAHGHPNAHESVSRLASESQKTGKTLYELLLQDKTLESCFKKFDQKQSSILKNPENYIGIAGRKVEDVCRYWEKELGL